MPDYHKTQYCLEIQVLLTKDMATTPPPQHAWQAPVVEDMLQDSKSGLTEVVVMGPGQAILFYGRQSSGEGLSLGKACNAMFTLSGIISWVGKQVQLNTNALSLWEGCQLIAQATTKWCTQDRGPGCPNPHLPALLPFRFCNHDRSLQKERLQSTDKCVKKPSHTHQTHTMTKGGYHNMARTTARCDKTHGPHQLQHFHLHWIMALRVTEVQCQLPHQYHQGPIDLETPGICTMVNAAGS